MTLPEWLWSPFGMGAWLWFVPIAIIVAIIGATLDKTKERKQNGPR